MWRSPGAGIQPQPWSLGRGSHPTAHWKSSSVADISRRTSGRPKGRTRRSSPSPELVGLCSPSPPGMSGGALLACWGSSPLRSHPGRWDGSCPTKLQVHPGQISGCVQSAAALTSPAKIFCMGQHGGAQEGGLHAPLPRTQLPKHLVHPHSHPGAPALSPPHEKSFVWAAGGPDSHHLPPRDSSARNKAPLTGSLPSVPLGKWLHRGRAAPPQPHIAFVPRRLGQLEVCASQQPSQNGPVTAKISQVAGG